MEIFSTHGVNLATLWPHIGHYLEDVCNRSRGEITPRSFKAEVESGQAQLWVIADPERVGPERFRAILGTTLAHTMSGMKVCNIILCAGKGRKDWLHLVLNNLADWARSEGCVKFKISARRGWVKDLPSFKVVGNDMEMDLSHERKDREDNPQHV